jgi:hypothetical protein
MFFVRVFPVAAAKAKPPAKVRQSIKADLVADILDAIDWAEGLAANLEPSEIEKKMLPHVRRRWKELKPDDETEPPASRTLIFLTYQEYLTTRSGK